MPFVQRRSRTESRSTFTPSARLTVRFHTETKDFATFLIGNLTASPEIGEARFGIVEFATNSEVTSALTTPVNAINAVNGIVYTGGWTNTEQAIRNCTETLKDSTADEIITVLLTDGAPTTFGEFATGRAPGCEADGGPKDSPCREAAVTAADEAKAAGISLATVLVSTVSASGSFLEKNISSPDLYFPATDFSQLDLLVDDIVSRIDPCD